MMELEEGGLAARQAPACPAAAGPLESKSSPSQRHLQVRQVRSHPLTGFEVWVLELGGFVPAMRVFHMSFPMSISPGL